MNKILTAVIALCLNLSVIGCGTEPSSETDKDERHVWSDQTDAIERAKEVEATVLKAAEEKRQALQAMED